MLPRIVISAFAAALLLGVFITGGSMAQVKARGAGDGVSKAPTEKRSQSIEIVKCAIRLLDEVTLASDRPGIISFVKPREGDTVREGDLVAGLQDDVAKATLAIAAFEAESDIEIRYSEKASQVAEVEHQKALEANRTVKAIPEVEVLRLKLAAEKTLLELESARHKQAVSRLKRDEAQAQLDTLSIKAPFSGVVTVVHRAKGEAVKQGDQVLELVSTDKVRVDGLVDIRDVWNIKPGVEVEVRLDIAGAELEVEKQTFRGRLMFIDVRAEPVSQAVRVWAEVDNPDNLLRAGLFAKMTIYPDRPAPTTPSK